MNSFLYNWLGLTNCASVFLDLAGFAPATLKDLTPMLWLVVFSHQRVPLA